MSTTPTIERPSAESPVLTKNPDEIYAMLRDGRLVLFDVRETDEHAREHIAGSLLMPLSTFNPSTLCATLKQGQAVAFHCKGGKRSLDAASRICQANSKGLQVISMEGGIEAWKAAKLPVVTNTKVAPISIMRQVQIVAGLITLVGSLLAWFVDPLFLGIPAFIGAGLTFAGVTGTCALATVLRLMPWNRLNPSNASCTR